MRGDAKEKIFMSTFQRFEKFLEKFVLLQNREETDQQSNLSEVYNHYWTILWSRYDSVIAISNISGMPPSDGWSNSHPDKKLALSWACCEERSSPATYYLPNIAKAAQCLCRVAVTTYWDIETTWEKGLSGREINRRVCCIFFIKVYRTILFTLSLQFWMFDNKCSNIVLRCDRYGDNNTLIQRIQVIVQGLVNEAAEVHRLGTFWRTFFISIMHRHLNNETLHRGGTLWHVIARNSIHTNARMLFTWTFFDRFLTCNYSTTGCTVSQYKTAFEHYLIRRFLLSFSFSFELFIDWLID